MTALATSTPALDALPGWEPDDGPLLLLDDGPPTPAPGRFYARVGARQLLEAARDVAPVVPGRPPVPVLGFVLLRPTAGGLELVATDYEATMLRRLPLAATSGAPTLVTPRELIRWALAAGAGTLVLAEDAAGRLVVSDGRYRRVREALPDGLLEEFPPAPLWDDAPVEPVTNLGTLTWGTLTHLLGAGMAAALDPTPPVLMAVQFRTDGETWTAVATDRYRLHLTTAGADQVDAKDRPTHDPVEVLVAQKKAAALLRRFGRGTTLDVDVSTRPGVFGSRVLRLSHDGGWLALACMEGEYPPVLRLFPSDTGQDHTVTLLLHRAALRQAVDATGEGRDPVTLTVDPPARRLTVTGGDGNTTTTAALAVTDQWVTDPAAAQLLTVAFNRRYLLDALDAFTHQLVQVRLWQPTKPGLFAGVHSDALDPASRAPALHRSPWHPAVDATSTHLLMPIRQAG